MLQHFVYTYKIVRETWNRLNSTFSDSKHDGKIIILSSMIEISNTKNESKWTGNLLGKQKFASSIYKITIFCRTKFVVDWNQYDLQDEWEYPFFIVSTNKIFNVYYSLSMREISMRRNTCCYGSYWINLFSLILSIWDLCLNNSL